jgi:SAM-dependent methyltransferase
MLFGPIVVDLGSQVKRPGAGQPAPATRPGLGGAGGAGMRLTLHGDGLLERLALRIGLVPTPAAESWGGMALSGVLVAATRTGLTARLAAGAYTVEEAATGLRLDPTATRLLLDCLEAAGYVVRDGGRYTLSRTGRRWLDPDARLSVGRFVAGTGDYWTWWSGLPEVLRTGAPAPQHLAPPEDPYWDRYIHGQFELARLSADEVARRLRVPRSARSVLDVGGGHGWYSAVLCRRYPELQATVLDLPGSVRVGRQIIAASGLSERVSYRVGDALDADLGGGYDLVLCFNLVHHLVPDQITGMFARIRAALAPGGSVAVMDAFAPPARRVKSRRAKSRRVHPSAATLGLFMYLSSGGGCYSIAQLHDWLARAGFARPRRVAMRRIPGLALYQATAGHTG